MAPQEITPEVTTGLMDDLSVPKGRRRRRRVDARQIVADIVEGSAAFLGRPAFITILGILVVAWISWNSIGHAANFDPYPFVFLILILSIQASVSAPLILFSQNRQAERDRVKAQQDRDQALRTNAEVEFLAVELADTRLRINQIEASLRKVVRLLETDER